MKIAFIPARGGSKSIPDKNIKIINGKPLIYWVCEAAQLSDIDKIVLATDSKKIAEVALSFGFSKLVVYDRKKENAQDTSSTESVMLEYINEESLNNDDTLILIQATSPLLSYQDLDKGLKQAEKGDSILSVVPSKRFYWSAQGQPENYDPFQRPRRQDFEGNYVENGAFYISTVEKIKESQNRISGSINMAIMPEYSFHEIDEPVDWIIVDQLIKTYKPHSEFRSSNKKKIKLFLSDIDGVLTDAGMYYTENGDEIKKFSTYDGMAFKLAKENGIKIGLITSENRELNKRRSEKLNMDFLFQGLEKLPTVIKLCAELNISMDEVAYIGDDINCKPLLENVGLAACPNNALPEIKSIPGIIQLHKSGGEGAVREFISHII